MRQRLGRWLGRALRIEQLEPRQLLATNMAMIEGTVFDDTDGDGVLDPTEDGIAGVTVTLTGTDVGGAVNRTDVTGADGSYQFDNLLAGTYQVTQTPPPPSGYLPNPGGSPANVVITTDDAQGADGTSIDSFNGTQQLVAATLPGTNPQQSSVADAQAIGGSRDLAAEVTTQLGQVELASNQAANPGVLASASANNTRARSTVTWDGGNDPNTVDFEGLNVDLTDGGQNTALRLMVGVDQPNQLLTIVVYTDDTNWSSATLGLTETGGLPTSELQVPFTVFTSMGNGADFTDVGAIQLRYVATELGSDFAVDWIRAVGPTRVVRNFANRASTPGIDLEKAVNGQDADTAGSGPQVYVGSTVVFTYTVRNTGNVALSNIQVRDDNGTPANNADDFSATYSSGDADNDSMLDLTEVWTFSSTRTATLGTHQNTARATGQDAVGEVVSDSDPANHVGVALPRLISKRRFLASS